MYICVTYVDAATKIPCNVAPMSTGPALPDVKGLVIKWGNESQWPTNYPLYYGTCDDDADVSIPGVIKTMTEAQYLSMRQTETDVKAMQVREYRDHLLRTEIDSLNPIRWGVMSIEKQDAYRVYRQALLDVPQQIEFPWNVVWPVTP